MIKVARRRAGHPAIRELAKNIYLQHRIESMHYFDEAKAIGEYVQRKVRYVRDATGIEQLHDPVMMIEQIIEGRAQGDCDDMALLIATLLLSTGHQPKFRAVRYNSIAFWKPYNHIYVVSYEHNPGEKNKRLPIDAIVKKKAIGFEVPHKSGKEFAV